MKYFSLFSGVGGFEIGIQRAYANKKVEGAGAHNPPVAGRQEAIDGAGVDTELPQQSGGNGTQDDQQPTCVGMSEIDKHASAVLRYRFPNVKNYGDISQIDWSTVPDFDLLVGGSPCQDLSIAGKRAGLEGGRSGLFYEYVRALEEKKPSHFIWENVKGALSSHGGRDFAAILTAFSEAGYSLWWQVLNAKDFGVPQNRERVFVVGTRGDGGREVFFEPRSDSKSFIKNTFNTGSCGGRIYDTAGVNPALSANGGGHGSKTGLIRSEGRIRRLTPREAERLMSWDDDWTQDWTRYGYFSTKEGEEYAKITGGLPPFLNKEEISDTQRYKMCGNGVVSAVVAEIVKAHLL